MSFDFHIAGPSDDADIRALLARNPVPGRVVVSYEREPSYFAGCAATDPFSQVIVARERSTGRLAAVASRSIRKLYVNGGSEDVGYLSQLRVDEAFRGRWLVSGGFRFLRELHDDGRAPGYLATITREGREARHVLVDRGRRHFPEFEPLAEISTIAIAIGRARAHRSSQFDASEFGDEPGVDLDDLVAFVTRQGIGRQFFPVTTVEDLARNDALLVARRSGRIAGLLRIWDQSSFKQAVVRGYGGSLGPIRPLYNLAMRLAGRRGLPAVGERIEFAFGCSVCVESVDAFAALLRLAHNRLSRSGHQYLVVGFTSDDPLLRYARSYPHVEYRSTLYGVHWDDFAGYRERLDDRRAYVEIATL